MSAFKGFPKEAFSFLAGLEDNNNRAWFDAHRAEYDDAIVGPALALVDELGARLRKIVPSLRPEPRIGGSLFRIHRDTRFSADKSPYKTHVGIRLRDGDTASSPKCAGPLFYIELTTRNLRIGAGIKEFDPPTLDSFRRAVAESAGARKFTRFIGEAEARGHRVLGDMLARVPAPYSRTTDNEMLKRKGLFVMEETRLPKIIHQPGFLAYCEDRLEPYAPLFSELRIVALADRRRIPT